MSALDTLLSTYEDRPPPAGERPVVGYVGPDVPPELIEASGLQPLRLRGGRQPSAEADAILGERVEPATRRILTELLDGAPCDYLLLSHSSDAAVRLYTSLRRIEERRRPELGFLDLLHLPAPTTEAYDLDRLRELRELLGRWSGSAASDERLSAAIAEGNRTRRLLGRLKKGRRALRPLLSGTQALAVIGAGTALPAARFNGLLKLLLSGAGEAQPEPSRRIYLSGSSHDTPELYLALESDRSQVSGEDHDWGEALGDGLVNEAGDPVLALAERYGSRSALARRFRTNERAAHCAAEAVSARADVVVSWIREGDDALAWGLPALRRAVEARGIAFVSLERRGTGVEGAAELVGAP